MFTITHKTLGFPLNDVRKQSSQYECVMLLLHNKYHFVKLNCVSLWDTVGADGFRSPITD